MTVAIIDYGSGNLRSAAKAFARLSAVPVQVTSSPAEVARASRIVLPGVGAFADCRRGLQALPGMEETLTRAVLEQGCPFLGICVGMQLLAATGEEHGAHTGLGWLPGRVVPLDPADPGLKIPHMGWNSIRARRPHPLLAGLGPAPYFYFVHSFHMLPDEPGDVLAETAHGGPVTAMVARDNMAGVQFHPEKSQRAGARLIANFLEWKP